MDVAMIVLSMAMQKLVSCKLITIIASFHPVVYVDSGSSPGFESLLSSSVVESLLSASSIFVSVSVSHWSYLCGIPSTWFEALEASLFPFLSSRWFGDISCLGLSIDVIIFESLDVDCTGPLVCRSIASDLRRNFGSLYFNGLFLDSTTA